MPFFTDQTGHSFFLPHTPQRIISLVPSQTELLFDLGLDTQVVGITKFCIHPRTWYQTRTRIGGTKDIKTDLIRSLQPDLIIANKEENLKEQVTSLMASIPTYVSDINNIPDALAMMRDLGQITGKAEAADQIVTDVAQGFAALLATPPIDAAYLIWREPYMTVGGDTFISHMMERAGFRNAFGNRNRYPAVSVEEIRQSGCRLLLLSSEPYPFREKHQEELRLALPGVQVLLADGELFSWYGSRMRLAPSYFRQLQQQAAQLFQPYPRS